MQNRSYARNVLLAMTASGVIFVVEIWAGFKTGSLALFSDAGHAFVDLSGLAFALAALYVARRPANSHATYGYGRAEVLAAAINGLLVTAIAAAIVWQGVIRLRTPVAELDSGFIMLIAGVSLLVNVGAALFLHGDSQENMSSKGAFVNVVGDALASLGVLISAILVQVTGNTIWDTIVSFLVAAIILTAAWKLLEGALSILLEWAPAHLQPEEIKETVESLPDVVNVHDLHIWTLTPGHHSLSMHVSINVNSAWRWPLVTQGIEEMLAERFGLEHCTIQVEPAGQDLVSDVYNPVTGDMFHVTR